MVIWYIALVLFLLAIVIASFHAATITRHKPRRPDQAQQLENLLASVESLRVQLQNATQPLLGENRMVQQREILTLMRAIDHRLGESRSVHVSPGASGFEVEQLIAEITPKYRHDA